MKTTALLTTDLPGLPKRSGKVRDIYELPDDRLLIVATDRISAFDVVMANGIPDKGRVLTQISLFWFHLLADLTPNHVLSSSLKDLPEGARDDSLDGRFMICRKLKVVPIECVVRGYLAGSGWKEYSQSGTVCGLPLPAGLTQCAKLEQPIFTPSTKAEVGHDENISFDETAKRIGSDLAAQLREKSLAIYEKARSYAAEKGLIIADTKFEWGLDKAGRLILIDEALTPDSSRIWPADSYEAGRDQPSFDKQFVRDYLDKVRFNRQPPGPALPAEIVRKTRKKYVEAYTRLTGQEFPWD
jgi:phosphoribosylaminoimidazole-succinocarboxamide synthase